MPTPIDYFVSAVADDYDFNQLTVYQTPAPSPLVYPLLYGPVTLTPQPVSYSFDTLWVTTKPDVGKNPFIGGYIVRVDNQATLADDGSVPTYHSIQYRTQPPEGTEPGWYTHNVNFGIFALVKVYENLPPDIVSFDKLSYTYSTGSRKVTAHIVDMIGAPMDSIGVKLANIRYNVNGGELMSLPMELVSGDSVVGIWSGAIPGQLVGDSVSYCIVAVDLQGATDTSNMHGYAVKAGTPGNILFYNDDYYGPPYSYDAIHTVYSYVDDWDGKKWGTPDSSVIDFYTNGAGQNIIIWNSWGGTAFAEDANLIAYFLDSSGKMWISSQDMFWSLSGDYCFGTYCGGIFIPGTFPYEYLRIISVNDNFFHDSTITFYGIAGDPISEPFTEGVLVYPYAFHGPGWNWAGKFDSLREGIKPIFCYETGEVTGYRYEDPDKGYKLVFLYWPFAYINEFANPRKPDTSSQNTLVRNILNWFGAVGVEEEAITPATMTYFLSQNTPNPVTSTTTISYTLLRTSKVSLKVYDVTGRFVKTLIDAKREAGTYDAVWDLKNDLGKRVASGIYFYRLTADNFTSTRKVIILK